MVVGILWVVLSIKYLLERSRLQGLTPSCFPQVPVREFRRWYELKLRGIDIFLWSIGVYLGLGFCCTLLGTNGIAYTLYSLPFLLVALIFSTITSSQADKLEKSLGFNWKKIDQKALRMAQLAREGGANVWNRLDQDAPQEPVEPIIPPEMLWCHTGRDKPE